MSIFYGHLWHLVNKQKFKDLTICAPIYARLKVLETELDTKLFYRKYNGLVPTESGELFLSIL